MNEFKITKALSAEVSDIGNSGENINDDYSLIPSIGVDTLQTALGYISQHKEIKGILDLYKDLVSKDVADLKNMIAEIEAMDEKIAAVNRG